MARLPVAFPDEVGANVMATETDCPAAIVLGVVMPVRVKSASFNVRTETVRSADPVFDKTRLLVLFRPLDTVPKLIDAGLTDSCGVAAVTADAARSTTTGVVPLSPVTVRVPVMFPVADGLIPTLNFVDCPDARAMGMLMPEIENCGFEICAEVMFRDALPVFETVTDCANCLPTVTWPKLTLAGIAWKVSSGWPDELPAEVRPRQPFSIATAGRTATRTNC